MKLIKNILVTILLSTTSIAMSATDTTVVEMNVTKDVSVELIGTLSNSQTVNFSTDDIIAHITNIGTLGAKTNAPGGCHVAISSSHDFKLTHDTDPSLFLNYTVLWNGSTLNAASGNYEVPITYCSNPANLTSGFFIHSPFVAGPITAGIYSDTLNIILTAQ